jgi:hypothetical protein
LFCGGDTLDEHGISDNPEEHAKNILAGRDRIIQILNEAGFGKPHVRWNELGETTCLAADLEMSLIYIHNIGGELARYPIRQN